jgi:hypothetical protein
VWEHLSRAGFVTGSYVWAATETPASTPTNPYARYIQVVFDNAYGTGTPSARHNIKTGNQIPSDILSEIDRKVDDGNPNSGVFQFSTYAGGAGTAPTVATCTVTGPPVAWILPAAPNCGGASLL